MFSSIWKELPLEGSSAEILALQPVEVWNLCLQLPLFSDHVILDNLDSLQNPWGFIEINCLSSHRCPFLIQCSYLLERTINTCTDLQLSLNQDFIINLNSCHKIGVYISSLLYPDLYISTTICSIPNQPDTQKGIWSKN